MRRISHESCDRARRWVSVSLDDGLSDLEGRLLDTHLAHCEECRAFQRRVQAVTAELRRAELVGLDRPIALPARRVRFSALRVASASAAAAAAALLLFGVLSLTTSTERVRSVFPRAAIINNTEATDFRRVHRGELVTKLRPAFTHVQIARADRV